MSKIDALILDAGFSSLPLLQASMSFGHSVGVCSGKLSDPGHLLAKKSFPINYANREEVLKLARKENIQAILPGVTDMSYLSGAWIAEQLGLPGFDSTDTTNLLLKKDKFRVYAQRKGFPVPNAVTSVEAANQLHYPILVKPTDAYSGRGVVQVNQKENVKEAYQTAIRESVSGEAVLEEFKEGSLHSHSAFIRDGRIACEFFVNEFCTIYPYQVNSSCLNIQMDETLKNRISDCLQALVSDLQLCDGLLHTQFIYNGKDFWLIEVTRRCPGDLYSQLVQYSTNIAYSTLFVAPFFRHSVPISEYRPALKRFISRHTVSTSESVPFMALQCERAPCRVIEAVLLKTCGEVLQAAPQDRAGIIFSEFKNVEEMSFHTQFLKDYFFVKSTFARQE
ncbi:ATP-grasp domain-containing protein [Pectobacteriaceae bacterium CE90]|nr:ATP-grasp domain-containing protein [Pectobacteriaceae bacterium CE90]